MISLLPPSVEGGPRCPGCHHYRQMLQIEEERWQPAWQAFHWGWALLLFVCVIVPVAIGAGTRVWTWALS